jgi:hypothetical protein
MTNLIFGANSRFGKVLKNHLPGIYLTRDDFDLLAPKFEQFESMVVENIIFLTKSDATNFQQVGQSCDSVFRLINQIEYQTAWIFTSGLGTYIGSKNSDHICYSAEKALLNFVAFKKNHKNNNIKIIHPGHMGTDEEYQLMVDKFLKLMSAPPEKNLIWSLDKNSYIPY